MTNKNTFLVLLCIGYLREGWTAACVKLFQTNKSALTCFYSVLFVCLTNSMPKVINWQ